MSKFICHNPDCPKCGIEDEYLTNTYKMINGKLQSDHVFCPKCGKEREEINDRGNIPIDEKNIAIGEYTGASPERQREMLKKRSHDHYMKEILPYKEYKLHETVTAFKEASKV